MIPDNVFHFILHAIVHLMAACFSGAALMHPKRRARHPVAPAVAPDLDDYNLIA